MATIDKRLQEATAILETMSDQQALLQADLWHWEQEAKDALVDAQRRSQEELQSWLSSEQHYRMLLEQWTLQQSTEVQAALDRRKTLEYRLLIFLACWLSGGLVLILETRAIQQLQSQRDHPPFGEQQRTWTRNLENARRKVEFLRSLQEPRPTPRLRECNQEVLSLRRRLDILDSQIQIQETRIRVLQQQRTEQNFIS